MIISIENHILHYRFGDEHAFEMIKEAGFDAVDYSFYWLPPELEEQVLGENYVSYADVVRAKLDELHLVCNQAHAPFEMDRNDTFELSNQKYLRLVRSLESAAIMGARQIIVHALQPVEGCDMTEYNHLFYTSLDPYCEKFGIQIAVENLFMEPWDPEAQTLCNKKFGSPEHMNTLIRRLDPRHFVVCVDVGHARLTGNEPEEFIRGIDTDRLRALHIQDNDLIHDSHTLPYLGKLNWNEICKSLAETKYPGDLTLEVFAYLNQIETDMMPAALRYAAATAKHLVKKIQSFY